MNSDQLGGIVRAILMAFSGYALEHGVTQDQWLAITGGAVAIVVVGWSIWSNSVPKQIISVAKSDDVKKVVVSPGLVFTTDNPKIVAK